MEWTGHVVRMGRSRKYWNKPGWLEIKWYISALVYTDHVNILGGSIHT